MGSKIKVASDGSLFEVLPDGSIKKHGSIPSSINENINTGKDGKDLSSSVVWWKGENMQPVSMFPLKLGWLFTVPIIGLIFRSFAFIFSIIPILYFPLRSSLFPNFLRKRRKELLDTDFIQEYPSRKVKYTIVARGSSSDHKYGVFNVKKIRLLVPFVYDKLEWLDQSKTLLAVKDGRSMVLDVKGNEFV